MSIRVRCGSCNGKLLLDDSAAGRSFNCPVCGNRVTVPDASVATPYPEASRVVTPSTRSSSPAPSPPAPRPAYDAELSEPLMKKTKEYNYEDLIDMTAMVDIVFFLLIFFLVTSLQTVDSAIDLPKLGGKKGAVSPNAPLPEEEEQASEITVKIDRADRVSVEGTEVRGPDEAFVKLRELRGGPDHPTALMIIGSGDATHGTLVSIMDSAQELGFEKIKLSVVEDGEGSQ